MLTSRKTEICEICKRTKITRTDRATCYLDQYGMGIKVPSMLRNGSFSWVVISRDPNRHVDEAWQELEEPPHDVEMVIFSSIEESNATEQQEQSSIPMDPPSKIFMPIDQRKWSDIPAVNSVKEESPAWRVSKKVTIFSRHQELHREIDGAICWCSLLLVLRRDFEIEGAGVFSDSQWLSLVHRGSNMPRFQYCLGLNENLMKIRAIQGHTGGDLVDPEVLNYVGTSAWMERVLVPCRRFTPRALHHASRAPRRWKGHERRTADCLLHISGLSGR